MSTTMRWLFCTLVCMIFTVSVHQPGRSQEAGTPDLNDPASVDPSEHTKENGDASDGSAEPAYPMELSPEAQELAGDLAQRLPPNSEARAMFDAIMAGKRLRPNVGWFSLSHSQTAFDWSIVRMRLDANRDDCIDMNELDDAMLFMAIDRDEDRKITQSDLAWDEESNAVASNRNEKEREHRSRGNNLSREILIRGLATQEIGSLQSGPNVGELAPNFSLSTFDGNSVVELKNEIGEKPLVLVFGNFTCGPFRRDSGGVKSVYERFQQHAKFVMVYVREAHPIGGWHSEDWEEEFLIEQPKTKTERDQVAQKCQRFTEFDFPFLVDEIDDSVGTQYSGMPSRLYVIDRSGRIVFKSGRGPHGFRPRQMQQALALLLSLEP